ncbi:MAG: type II toxin-antitoxin system RelE/ParE family toxin [Patescibacteria group bacterium]
MNWQIGVDDSARKYLKCIPKSDADRIAAVLEKIKIAGPYMGDIEKMKGQTNVWRRRVGSYRIMYEIYLGKRIVYVIEIERRTSKTY